jgi:hypothetical protein
MRDILKSQDLQASLEQARIMFPNPLMLTDISHNLLAITSEPQLLDPGWNEIRAFGGIPHIWTMNPAINEAYRTSAEEHRAVMDETGGRGIPVLRKALTTNNRVVGYLDSPAHYTLFNDKDISFFDFLGDICALRIAAGYEPGDAPENILGFFIRDLVSGHLTNRYIIEERVKRFGWKMSGRMRIVTMRFIKRRENITGEALQEAFNAIQAAYPDHTIFFFGTDIKILMHSERGFTRKSLEKKLRDMGMRGGVSNVFMDMTAFTVHDRQSLKALELGNVFDPDGHLHFYDRYAVYHALEFLQPHTDIMQFCHSALPILTEYDRRHNSNLLDTLSALLSGQNNQAAAATALGVHRNTLTNRIAKIRALTDADLSDGDTVANLVFSFALLKYHRRAAASPPVGAGPAALSTIR